MSVASRAWNVQAGSQCVSFCATVGVVTVSLANSKPCHHHSHYYSQLKSLSMCFRFDTTTGIRIGVRALQSSGVPRQTQLRSRRMKLHPPGSVTSSDLRRLVYEIYIKKQHLHTRGAETDNRGTAQYGGMTSGAKPSTGALRQRRRPQQQRAQPGQAAEATGQAQREGPERGRQRG